MLRASATVDASSFRLDLSTFFLCRRIIYHGPVTDVQRHFEDVGFSLPPRMDLPSWLVEITTPAGAQQLLRAVASLQSTLVFCRSRCAVCTLCYLLCSTPTDMNSSMLGSWTSRCAEQHACVRAIDMCLQASGSMGRIG